MDGRYVLNLRPALFAFGCFALGIYLYSFDLFLKCAAFAAIVLACVYFLLFGREKYRAQLCAFLLPAMYIFGWLWRGVNVIGFTVINDYIINLPVFTLSRERIISVLSSAMGDEEAAFAKALLLGDTTDIDGGLLNNIRYGGVAHIFAVSGLHISEIYLVAQKICKKLRVRREVKDAISAALVIYYTGVCGFSPSAIRASVMCIALSLSFYFFAKSDYLERVGLAGVITLFLNPAYLYKAGFVLSFFCCFGIGFFLNYFIKAFSMANIKNQRIAGGLAMTLSVNIATFPLFLDYFSAASLWGLLLNIVFVPIISAVFACLFVLCMLSAILPFAANVLLFIPALMLKIIIAFFKIADFTLVSAGGFSLGVGKVPYYIAVVLLSDKVNLKFFIKIICAVALFTAAFMCIIIT